MATTTGFIDYTEQGSAPTTPSTGHWRVFTKSDGLYIVDDAGVVTGPFAEATSAVNLESTKVVRSGVGSNRTNSTGYADMDGTNLTITMTTGARRVMLTLSFTCGGDNASASLGLNFSVDGTAVATESSGASKCLGAQGIGTGLVQISLVYITDVLSAGSHTFKPRWSQRAGSGHTITAYQSGADEQIVFTATELLAD